MRITFVSGNYPAPCRPERGTFVQQFVWAMARQGNECSVINPTRVFDRRYGPYPAPHAVEGSDSGPGVHVYRPMCMTFSSRDFGWMHTDHWTQRSLNLVVKRAIHELPSKPDLIYGHFLYHGGRAAVVAGRDLGVPSVVGVGEGTFWTVDAFGFERARKDFAPAGGFLAVASHIRHGLISRVGVPPSKILLAPNGVDPRQFFHSDRGQARVRLGLPPEMFIIAFVGAFDDLKGGAELVAAVGGMEGTGLVMIGQGEKTFKTDKIVHSGSVRHGEVATWLNAANIFALPTREEGSCNAVIEAMACGLPIVTSSGNYMDDIVDDEVALRVDPCDVGAIREAILALRNDDVRCRRMSEACLKKAAQFDINERARRVTEWMEGLSRRHREEGLS